MILHNIFVYVGIYIRPLSVATPMAYDGNVENKYNKTCKKKTSPRIIVKVCAKHTHLWKQN